VPTYEYECEKCGAHFELRRSFTEDGSSADCPKCHAEARRLFKPVPVIFKGSGFYVTDHHKPSPVNSSFSDAMEEKKATPAPKVEPKKAENKADGK
jgi:putative FmdB family regulatory protein